MITSILPRRVKALTREYELAVEKYGPMPNAPVEEPKEHWKDPTWHSAQLASETCTCGNAKPSMRYRCFMCAPGAKR